MCPRRTSPPHSLSDIIPDVKQVFARLLARLLATPGWPNGRATLPAGEPPLGPDEDPFDAPVILEITDIIDLHPIPPAECRAVVIEYLSEAHRCGYRYLRIIHGKGKGVQRRMVREVLAITPFVEWYGDAPPEAGGLGATIVNLRPSGETDVRAGGD